MPERVKFLRDGNIEAPVVDISDLICQSHCVCSQGPVTNQSFESRFQKQIIGSLLQFVLEFVLFIDNLRKGCSIRLVFLTWN